MLQREPHVAVVAGAIVVAAFRWASLGAAAKIGIAGLGLVVVHFVAQVLLFQMGNTGCHGCMPWSVGTHVALSDQVLPALLAVAWLLVAVAVVGRRGLWPNNSSKPTPLRGAA